MSIGEECDNDRLVIFGKSGGNIICQRTGEMQRLKRENGVYEMEFWLPPPNSPESMGFQRPG